MCINFKYANPSQTAEKESTFVLKIYLSVGALLKHIHVIYPAEIKSVRLTIVKNGLDLSTTPKPAIDSFTSLIWSIPSLK